MLNSGKEIWEDIDATLDQLLANASAMKRAISSEDLMQEVEALQKTQESLLARLVHRHTLLQNDKKKKITEELRTEALQKKLADYDKVHARLLAEANKHLSPKKMRRTNPNKPLIHSKRRTK